MTSGARAAFALVAALLCCSLAPALAQQYPWWAQLPKASGTRVE